MTTNETSFKWATVTGVSPLEIRLDGDTVPLALVPDSLIDPEEVSLGDRVRVEISSRKAIIHGKSGGVPIPEPEPEVGLRLLQTIRLTSSGTFVKADYPLLKKLEVQMVGGGGAGAGATSSAGRGGGGAGGYCERLMDVTELDASEPYTIGAQGSGSTSSTGASGGNTVAFGMTAEGGNGGTNGGGNGGGVSGAFDFGFGGAGGGGGSGTFESSGGLGGAGGSSPFGGGGGGVLAGSSNITGRSASGYGAGGGGAVRGGGSGSVSGGSGSPGLIVLKLYV